MKSTIKILFPSLALMLILANAYSQNSKVDSLFTFFEIKKGAEKVEILKQLNLELASTYPERALGYTKEMFDEIDDLKHDSLKVRVLNEMGVVYYYLNTYDQSTKYYFTALAIADSLQIPKLQIQLLNNIAWNYKMNMQYDKALEFFNKALLIAEDWGDLRLTQSLYNNMGAVYRLTHHYEKALDCFYKSLEINTQTDNKKWEAYNLNNIGLTFMDSGDYVLSKSYLEAAMLLNDEIGNEYEKVKIQLNIGFLHAQTNQPDSAEYYLESAYPIIMKENFRRHELDYYEYKYKLYENTGKFRKALGYMQKYHELSLDLLKLGHDETVAELSEKYQFAQREKELLKSTQQIKIQNAIIWSVSIAFVVLVLFSILLLYLLFAKNKYAKNIAQLHDELNIKAEDLRQANEKIQSMNEKLEDKVKRRTEEIQQQNVKLKQYAFMNSHEIRAPLARLLGLIYLMELENNPFTGDKMYAMFQSACKELDIIISEASKKLAKEHLLDDEPTTDEY